MKRIIYSADFKSPSGQTIYIDDPDTEKQREYALAETAKAEAAVAKDRETGANHIIVKASPLKVVADFPLALTWFLNGIPHTFEELTDAQEAQVAEGKRQRQLRKVNIQEAGAAYAVISAIQGLKDKDKTLDLEDGVYESLVKTAEVDAIEAFTAPVAGMLLARIKSLIPDPPPDTQKG